MELIENQLLRDIGFLIVLGGLWAWMVHEEKETDKRHKEWMEFWERQKREREKA